MGRLGLVLWVCAWCKKQFWVFREVRSVQQGLLICRCQRQTESRKLYHTVQGDEERESVELAPSNTFISRISRSFSYIYKTHSYGFPWLWCSLMHATWKQGSEAGWEPGGGLQAGFAFVQDNTAGGQPWGGAGVAWIVGVLGFSIT